MEKTGDNILYHDQQHCAVIKQYLVSAGTFMYVLHYKFYYNFNKLLILKTSDYFLS